MRIDEIDSYSNRALFGNYPVVFGAFEPSFSDRIDGLAWFEPNSVFPTPWFWNSAESVWLSSPIIFDFGYNTFTISTTGSSAWVNKTVPFYGVTNNRIFLKDLYANLYNVGSVAHTATLYYQFVLDKFLGSGLMSSTTTLNTDTAGMAVPSYINQVTPEAIPDRPASGSLRRITMQNLNLWLPGNTWYQRLRATRLGATTTASGVSIGISLIQVIQFARL